MGEKIQSMRKLADWISEYDWEVYYNQKNKSGYDIFRGPSKKPDLLLKKNGYNVLVEVKPGTKHKQILDGYQKTIDYAGQYWTGRQTDYYRDGKDESLEIDAFVLATQYSMDGFLYQKEQRTNTLDYSGYLAKKHDMDEYGITHTATRLMWREWEKGHNVDYFRDLRRSTNTQVRMKQKPKVGCLVSKVDQETKAATLEPHFFLNSNNFVPLGVEQIYAFN
jgi:hypothetical protein